MGFSDYARSIFFEKDTLKTKLLESDRIQYPQLSRDEVGFVCVFPEPIIEETEETGRTLSLMGYVLPDSAEGKLHLSSLFRASVYHMGAHALTFHAEDYEEWKKRKEKRLAEFTVSIIEDVKSNAFIASQHSDSLVDVAFANTMALKRLRRIDGLLNPATKIMSELLLRINVGSIPFPSGYTHKKVPRLVKLVERFKEDVLLSFNDKSPDLKKEQLKVADKIYSTIEDAGPITETPFLPHTEELGVSSIFWAPCAISSDVFSEEAFKRCLEFLGGAPPTQAGEEKAWKKLAEAEALQLFDAWERQKEKESKIISMYEGLLPLTKFKSVEIPPQDETESSRIKTNCRSETHRLIESLLVARDALDEDPRKLYGVLDLVDVIQVVASKSPRTDVFMLDENLSKSYSWAILLDASASMKCIKDFALSILILLAEAANALLLDPTSWGVYAFNDRLLVIKDFKERYNARVKARIGGIKFEGFTYMPDALLMAAKVIKGRADNLRLINIVSDGWAYGYPDIDASLSKVISTLRKGSISVFGIGAKSRRMGSIFKLGVTAYTLRDLAKRFSRLYMEASRIAVDT